MILVAAITWRSEYAWTKPSTPTAKSALHVMNDKKLRSAQHCSGKHRFVQFVKKLSKLSSVETKRLVVVVFGGDSGGWGIRCCFFYIPYRSGLMKTVLKIISSRCYRFSKECQSIFPPLSYLSFCTLLLVNWSLGVIFSPPGVVKLKPVAHLVQENVLFFDYAVLLNPVIYILGENLCWIGLIYLHETI